MKRIFTSALAITLFTAAQAQVSQPFSTCPTVVAVTRPGTNAYANNPISIYNLNTTTGAATVRPGGPLKDPANPANNMDINAIGLNAADGYLYGMRPDPTATTPKFYRIGSNYSIEQVGTIAAPVAAFPSVGVVNSAGAEFDGGGTYYFTAATALVSFVPPSATPTNFYVGTLSNVAGMPASTSAVLTPTYVRMDFSGANCSEFYSTITTPVTSASSINNTGLRDLIFNPRDGKLYAYTTFETAPGSGIFKGQLFSVIPSTGAVTCYPASVLPFANASNEVAGNVLLISGEIEVLFTDGSVYKTDMAGTNVFTGTISPVGNSGVTGGLRGDLAGCILAGTVPVKLEKFTASENDCKVKYQWTVSQEENMSGYDLEILRNGQFVSATKVTPTNSTTAHTYTVSIPVSDKVMTARLKQTDLDGDFEYSNIIKTATSCTAAKGMIVLNSGSVTDNLQVRWSNFSATENMKVAVYNATGAMVSKNNFSTNSGTSSLNISNLPAGVYMITAQTASGEKFTERFIKK